MSKSRTPRLAVLTALLLAIVSACGGTGSTDSTSGPDGTDVSTTSAGAATSTSATTSAGGVARVQEVGLYPAFYGEDPFAYIDQPNGNYTGIDAEVVKACASTLGLDPLTEIFPVQVQWDSLIPGLVSQRYDVIGAGMGLNDERLEVAIATQPMYVTGSRAMVPAGNPLNIHSWDDITAADTEFGYITGGLEGQFAEEIGVASVGYDTIDAMTRDLEAGRLDVIITAELTLARYLETTGAPFELADPWDYQGQEFRPTLYFNSADVDLRDAFNDCLSEMKEDGSLAEIVEQFNLSASNLEPVGPGLP